MEASNVEAAAASIPPRDAARATFAPLGRPAAYAAELFGTLTLVLFIVIVVSLTAPADDGGLGFTDFAVIGLVHVFVLMLLIHSLGAASGAHFNPAVTIALTVKRKIEPGDAAFYIVVQLLGALLGAIIAKVLVDDFGVAVEYGSTTVSDRLDGEAGKGIIAEFIGAFFLMWSIMAMAVNPSSDRSWAPFVIGATLGLGVMCMAPLTGAGFNPARSFGPAVIGTFDGAGNFLLVYVLGPILGALAAAFAYSAIVLDPQERTEARPIDTYD
jgi:glycerol uptake facilitator protein